MTRPRLLLADDHSLVLAAFRTMLEPEYDIVAQVADGRALVEAAKQFRPDIVVTDVYMPLLNGLDAIRQVQRDVHHSKFVILTMDPNPDLASLSFRLGASGYLLKNSGGAELKKCLATVLSGRRFLTYAIAGGSIPDLLLECQDSAMPDKLSQREREVLQLIAEGRSMKEVADIAEMSTRTVQFHKYRIMERFHLKSTAEIVKFAIRNNLTAA